MPIATILSELKAIAGVLIPPVRKKYFDQPRLHLSIRKVGGDSKSNLGLSIHNELKTEIIEGKTMEFIDGNNAIHFFQIDRHFQMNVHNNSEHHAYNLRLLKPNSSHDCKIEPLINYLKPLKQNESESFTLTFSGIHEVTGHESVLIFNTPSDYFIKNKIIVEYCNVKGTKFYTEYDLNKMEEERNTFHRKNPLR
jgi:hypothetical protein